MKKKGRKFLKTRAKVTSGGSKFKIQLSACPPTEEANRGKFNIGLPERQPLDCKFAPLNRKSTTSKTSGRLHSYGERSHFSRQTPSFGRRDLRFEFTVPREGLTACLGTTSAMLPVTPHLLSAPYQHRLDPSHHHHQRSTSTFTAINPHIAINSHIAIHSHIAGRHRCHRRRSVHVVHVAVAHSPPGWIVYLLGRTTVL